MLKCCRVSKPLHQESGPHGQQRLWGELCFDPQACCAPQGLGSDYTSKDDYARLPWPVLEKK